MSRSLLWSALVFFSAWINSEAVAANAEPPKHELIMGFVPSRDVNEIQLSANKISNYLSERTGYHVKSITVQNYAAIVVGMNNKNIDIAFIGPLDYVVSHIKNGAYPITASIRNGKKGYNGIIVVRKDSHINSLKDLINKKVALGDALSASSNLYPKAAMRVAGIDPVNDIRTLTLSSASATVVSVLQGKVDAGAVYSDARTNSEVMARFPNILNETKIIYTSELIPADPQIVRKDLNPEQVSALKKGLLDLSSDHTGKLWLKALFGIDKLEPAVDSDYDGIRKVIRSANPALLNK